MTNILTTTRTKYLSLLITLAAFTLTSCGDSHDPLLESLMEQRDSLLQSSREKDTMIHQFTSSFAEIENNLSEITKKQTNISIHAGQKGEVIEKKSDEINKSISDINELMESNSKKIKSLNDQLKQAKYNNAALNKMVNLLFEHIMYKNNDLANLYLALSKESKSIIALTNINLSLDEYARQKTELNDIQKEELTKMDTQLNTAYYLLADSKELKKMCILDDNDKLKGGFNKTYFTRIDIRNETFIPDNRLAANDIKKLLTPHPASSYEFIKNDQGKTVNIKIKNQTDFWSRSKYLVIETK